MKTGLLSVGFLLTWVVASAAPQVSNYTETLSPEAFGSLAGSPAGAVSFLIDNRNSNQRVFFIRSGLSLYDFAAQRLGISLSKAEFVRVTFLSFERKDFIAGQVVRVSADNGKPALAIFFSRTDRITPDQIAVAFHVLSEATPGFTLLRPETLGDGP